MSQGATLRQMRGKVLPRLENLKKGQNWFNLYNPITIFRHVQSGNDGGSSPHGPTLRDPPHGENLNVEPVLQSAGVKDGETSVNQEEVTSTSPKAQQGRSNSSQVAAVNATAKDKCGAVRNRLVLQNETVNITPDENKFFDPGGKQDWCALPSRHGAVLLWFADMGVFSCEMFR